MVQNDYKESSEKPVSSLISSAVSCLSDSKLFCTFCYEDKIETKSKCLQINVSGCAQNATQFKELCNVNNRTNFLKNMVTNLFLLCSFLMKRANFIKT